MYTGYDCEKLPFSSRALPPLKAFFSLPKLPNYSPGDVVVVNTTFGHTFDRVEKGTVGEVYVVGYRYMVMKFFAGRTLGQTRYVPVLPSQWCNWTRIASNVKRHLPAYRVHSPGLAYRNTQSFEDRAERVASWGDEVLGYLSEDGKWLAVDGLFLPVFADGKRVLMRIENKWDVTEKGMVVLSGTDNGPVDSARFCPHGFSMVANAFGHWYFGAISFLDYLRHLRQKPRLRDHDLDALSELQHEIFSTEGSASADPSHRPSRAVDALLDSKKYQNRTLQSGWLVLVHASQERAVDAPAAVLIRRTAQAGPRLLYKLDTDANLLTRLIGEDIEAREDFAQASGAHSSDQEHNAV